MKQCEDDYKEYIHDKQAFCEKIVENMFQTACSRGDEEIVNKMIKYGACNINNGFLAACEGGHLNIVIKMYNLGATAVRSGYRRARDHNHTDIIDYLQNRYMPIIYYTRAVRDTNDILLYNVFMMHIKNSNRVLFHDAVKDFFDVMLVIYMLMKHGRCLPRLPIELKHMIVKMLVV
jgi:hypothetical protein